MNYIAHLHIARRTGTSYAGNLLGDFQWTPSPASPAFYQAWRLHQRVDQYVDSHPQSDRFKGMARQGRRRFAGIVQDILMDYWLIREWGQFEAEPFEAFAAEAVYGLVQDKADCPERLQRMIESLQKENWLPHLGTEEGVDRALRSIQMRWSLGPYLTPFIDELPELIEQAKEPFQRFYPELLLDLPNLLQDIELKG